MLGSMSTMYVLRTLHTAKITNSPLVCKTSHITISKDGSNNNSSSSLERSNSNPSQLRSRMGVQPSPMSKLQQQPKVSCSSLFSGSF